MTCGHVRVDVPCRVIICGASDAFHVGLTTILTAAQGIQVVGEFDIASYCPRRLAELSPGVLLIDLEAFGRDIEEIVMAASAQAESPVRVIGLTSSCDVDLALQVLRDGAYGLLLKDAQVQQLVTAVRSVGRGGAAVAPHVARRLVDHFRSGAAAQKVVPKLQPEPALTSRQRDVLTLLGQGLTNEEIAGRMYLSKTTVKSHISALLRALSMRDRIQLALFANSHDLS